MVSTNKSKSSHQRGSVSFEFRALASGVAPHASRSRSDCSSRFTTSGASRTQPYGGIARRALFVAAVVGSSACSNDAKKSAGFAKEHVQALSAIVHEDVREVRTGLPLGSSELGKLLPAEGDVDAQSAREALEKARNKVQDLRIAKSTFFAFVAPNGVVVRDDQQQDRLAGKNLLEAFPALRAALATDKLVETRGSMPEAAEVRGKPDGQWVAGAAVRTGSTTRGLYVTGWSWSAYAYRLENAVRSAARSAASAPQKEPLLYAFVIVEGQVYGAPVSPEVNARAVHDHVPVAELKDGAPLVVELEITGRGFGLAAELAPDLGPKVAIAVLRSET